MLDAAEARKIRRRWQSWTHQIFSQMVEPALQDRAMYERYVVIVESNPQIAAPGNFHRWLIQNYGRTLCIRLRKIGDTNQQAISLRHLLGQIYHNSGVLTRRSLFQRYGRRWRHMAEINWTLYCGGSEHEILPRSVVAADLEVVKREAKHAIDYVNEEIAHHAKNRRYRSVDFSSLHDKLDGLHRVLAKYGDLVGHQVPYPYSLVDRSDWDSIFKKPWICDD